MAKLIIRDIRARPVLVPFRIPLMSASGGIPSAPIVLLDLVTEEGVTGRSYLFPYAQAMLKPVVDCIAAVRDALKGDTLAPLDNDHKLRQRFKLLDTQGLLGLAVAGVDMCAWDALARAHDLPLARLLGGEVRPVRAYNSCGLWIQPVDRLAAQAEALIAEGDFGAVKLRIGRDDPREDLAAARAVRKRLPEDIHLMSDFNQRLSVNQAILRGRMLDDEGLYWIEEPVRHDDYAGCARVCAELQTPIQGGENLANTFELAQAIETAAFDYVMPDVQRIGGVSGWLRAAAIAHAHGIEMSSHLFPEFSAHLLAVTPTCHYLEYVDWAAPLLTEPMRIENGHAVISERPGAGLDWDEDAVKRFLMA
jgi:mandelate racemase